MLYRADENQVEPAKSIGPLLNRFALPRDLLPPLLFNPLDGDIFAIEEFILKDLTFKVPKNLHHQPIRLYLPAPFLGPLTLCKHYL